MKKIGMCNNKGGVGKTTICFCLAGALAEMGKKVLVVDMDQQGSLSSSFLPNIHDLPCVISEILLDGSRPITDCIHKTQYDLIDIVPANLSLGRIEAELLSERDSHYYLADKVGAIEGDYDVTLFDCPPNLGIATWSVLIASEGIIIPLEAQDYSVKGTGYVHDIIGKVRRRANPQLKLLGYLINRFDSRRRVEKDFRRVIEKQLGDKVFKQVLKDSVKYVECVTVKKPITFFDPGGEHAQAFRELAKEVLS